MLMPKVSCSCVCLYRLLSTTSGTSPRFNSMTSRMPDFITRYPSLLRKPVSGLVAGWEVECNATGLPFAWTPLTVAELGGQRAGTAKIVSLRPILWTRPIPTSRNCILTPPPAYC